MPTKVGASNVIVLTGATLDALFGPDPRCGACGCDEPDEGEIHCGACHGHHADNSEACPDYHRWLTAAPARPRNGDYEGACLDAADADGEGWGCY